DCVFSVGVGRCFASLTGSFVGYCDGGALDDCAVLVGYVTYERSVKDLGVGQTGRQAHCQKRSEQRAQSSCRQRQPEAYLSHDDLLQEGLAHWYDQSGTLNVICWSYIEMSYLVEPCGD